MKRGQKLVILALKNIEKVEHGGAKTDQPTEIEPHSHSSTYKQGNLENVESVDYSGDETSQPLEKEPEPQPSTSYQPDCAPLQQSLDFSSDDSVQDPPYQLPPNHDLSSSSSEDELPRDPAGTSYEPTKISLRLLKKEKKAKRNLGKSYKTLKGKSIPARQMTDLSACRMKCKDRLSFNDRLAVFTEYWGLGSYSKRTAYMASLMEIEDKATMRLRTSDPSKQKFRTKTYKYFLSVHGKREPICRGCLLKVLSETDNFIKTVALKKRASTAGTLTDDMRGKGFVPKHKIPESVRQEIKQHILSFPSYESHYTRKSTSKRYLPSHLTLQEMYNLFREGRENSPSIKIYRQEFHKLNLAFKKPRVDTCVTCDKFKITIQCTSDEHEKSVAMSQHEQHKTLADQAYSEKALDTTLCKNDEFVAVYTFDLQQCLPTPALTSSVVFYKRQLWTYNLTVHNNKTGRAVCYVWYETVAARGANQIASCLYKHLQLYVPNNVKHVIFYSDTICAGQNRNSHVSAMFTWSLQHLNIEKIDHKFMVPGHSHLEVDTDHGIIEKKKKKTNLQIYHPHDWIQLIKSSSAKFDVYEMKSNDFLEFSSLLKGPLVLRSKDSEGNPFKWLEKRWLRYEKDFGMILYKNGLDRETPFQNFNLKRRSGLVPENIPICSINPLPISAEKKQDLISLFALIPEVFHNFYRNLPAQGNVRDTDPDIIDDENEIDF